MAQEKFAVRLSEEDRPQLEGLVRRGQRSARIIKGRNPDADALELAITAYETRRNTACVPINWRFSTDDVGTKLHRSYPCLSKVD